MIYNLKVIKKTDMLKIFLKAHSLINFIVYN